MTHTAQSYDPEERRNTPLARKLKERIRAGGPISVAAYMDACLQDVEFGYYRSQRAIGAAGDFVTAPEISQVFGELIGLWSAVVWQQMGKPNPLHLVELGPGRGTLMRDALRAMRVLPGFLDATRVHLVESNPVLAGMQAAALAEAAPRLRQFKTWPETIAQLTEAQQSLISRHEAENGADAKLRLPIFSGPTILLANEFLDVLPIRQIIWHHGAWHHRQIGIDAAGDLAFVVGPQSGTTPAVTRSATEGNVAEYSFAHHQVIAGLLSARAKLGAVAALLIDYGHDEPGYGDTLQAVRGHKYESVFASPGEADLTAQVDFASVAHEARRLDLVVDGPVTQAEFLGRLGIIERASKLMGANPGKAGEIEAGVMRLMAPNGMGTRFKVIGIRSPNVAKLPGFE